MWSYCLKGHIAKRVYMCVFRLLCPVLPPSFHLYGDQWRRCMPVPPTARLHQLCTPSLSGHEGLSQATIQHPGKAQNSNSKVQTTFWPCLKCTFNIQVTSTSCMVYVELLFKTTQDLCNRFFSGFSND